MSKSTAAFVVIRDGQQRNYEDRWATLFRELLWGPDELEEWLTQGEEIDYEIEDLSGGAVVNFDSRELTWYEMESLDLPRVQTVHQRLLEHAWPGFRVSMGSESALRAAPDGHSVNSDDDDLYPRPETVREAAGLFDEDEEPEEETDYDDDTPRAWVTLVDKKGNARQRNLDQVSQDIINGDKAAIEQLVKFKAAEVPREKAVTEGMWIHVKAREIGFWGGPMAARHFSRLQKSWPKWTVRWAENGYADQCQVSDLPGVPMSDAEALAEIVPAILSTKRFDMGAVLGAFGGELKAGARKATGCLLLVLAIPILIFGYFADNMKAAGMAIAVLVGVVAVAFKVIESKLKSRFRKAPFNQDNDTDGRPPVVGPLDENERRERFDRLLSACGFPLIAELEPHFPEEPSLNDMM